MLKKLLRKSNLPEPTFSVTSGCCINCLEEHYFHRSIGIAPATLLRWMKDPEFDAAYKVAKRDAFGQAIARLQQGTSAAATTLMKIMIDPSAPASVRVRAADSVLDRAAKAIEIEEIEARVAVLEQAASGKPRR